GQRLRLGALNVLIPGFLSGKPFDALEIRALLGRSRLTRCPRRRTGNGGADEPIGKPRPQLGGDAGAPVAAIGAESPVSQLVHQANPDLDDPVRRAAVE